MSEQRIAEYRDQVVSVAVRQYRECNAAWGNINTGEHHECMLLNGHACEHRCKCGATR